MSERLRTICAELAAYRAGWISYDRDHVLQLQRERVALVSGNRQDCEHESIVTADGNGSFCKYCGETIG